MPMFPTHITKPGLDLEYHPHAIEAAQADEFFQALKMQTQWLKEKFWFMGKEVFFPRKTAYFGDKPYFYSGKNRVPNPCTGIYLKIKTLIEEQFQLDPYNFMLVQLYEGGQDHVSWHADDEKSIVKNSTIASLSLGAERRFSLRPSKKSVLYDQNQHEPIINLDLQDGDVVLMKGATQQHWEHCIRQTKKEVGERINITFRYIV